MGGPGREAKRGPVSWAPFTCSPRPPSLTCRGIGVSVWMWGQVLCRGGQQCRDHDSRAVCCWSHSSLTLGLSLLQASVQVARSLK